MCDGEGMQSWQLIHPTEMLMLLGARSTGMAHPCCKHNYLNRER